MNRHKQLSLLFILIGALFAPAAHGMNKTNAKRFIARACDAATLYYTGDMFIRGGTNRLDNIAQEMRTGTDGQTDLNDPEAEQFIRDAVAPCQPRRHFAIKKSDQYAATHNTLHIEYVELRKALGYRNKYAQVKARIREEEQAITETRTFVEQHQKLAHKDPFKKWIPNKKQQAINDAQQELQKAVATVAAKRKVLEEIQSLIDAELNRHRFSAQHEVGGHINHNDNIHVAIASIGIPIATCIASRLAIPKLAHVGLKKIGVPHADMLAEPAALPVRMLGGFSANFNLIGMDNHFREQRADESVVNDPKILVAAAADLLAYGARDAFDDLRLHDNPTHQARKLVRRWSHPDSLERSKRFLERAIAAEKALQTKPTQEQT